MTPFEMALRQGFDEASAELYAETIMEGEYLAFEDDDSTEGGPDETDARSTSRQSKNP